jgi:hypothetical protein
MIRGCVSILAAIASLCVSLLALIIVIFVSIKLTDISFNGVNYEFTCLLGTNVDGNTFNSNNCIMLQILSGLTIGVGLIIGIIQCYTCNLCGLGGLLDGAFALCGAGAWGYAGGVIQSAVDSNGNLRNEYESTGQLSINNPSLAGVNPSSFTDEYDTVLSQRRAASIMCWVEFGLFCFLVIASVLKCCPGRHK